MGWDRLWGLVGGPIPHLEIFYILVTKSPQFCPDIRHGTQFSKTAFGQKQHFEQNLHRSSGYISKFLLWQVRHHLAEVKNREEREAQKKRRENMMLLMIAMEQKLSTTSVNYCRDLLENRSESKSMWITNNTGLIFRHMWNIITLLKYFDSMVAITDYIGWLNCEIV